MYLGIHTVCTIATCSNTKQVLDILGIDYMDKRVSSL